MKVKVEAIELSGTDRRYEFSSGVNIIKGPISSGKTTLIDSLRGVLGGSLKGMPPEARENVTDLVSDVVLGEEVFHVIRPFTSTRTATVTVAGEDEALRVPAIQRDATSDTTYGRWLMDKLGLPRLQVPLAPTKEVGDMSPVSINDYMMYAHLEQDEVMDSVMGHTNSFKNNKRKAVFNVSYGIYDVEVARLEEEKREKNRKLNNLKNRSETIEDFFEGTAFENEAEIKRELESKREELKELEESRKEEAQEISREYETEEMKEDLRDLNEEIEEVREEIDFHKRSKDQKEELLNQLKTQVKKMSKSMVAGELLVDFDFEVCPRCGSEVSSTRSENGECYLCLQHSKDIVEDGDLEREIERIEKQILETRELISNHRRMIESLSEREENLVEDKDDIENEIQYRVESYISREAEEIVEVSEKRATLKEKIDKFEEFLSLYEKLRNTEEKISELEVRIEEIEAEIEESYGDPKKVNERIEFLNGKYREFLDKVNAPKFERKGSTKIDEDTLLPIYMGRKMSSIKSPGLTVLLNVAHTLAHQVTSLEFSLPLPNIILADGVSGPIGREEGNIDENFDMGRVRSIYKLFSEVADEYGIQVIVADNEVPSGLDVDSEIEFTEDDRLIPSAMV
ncbi:putative nucleic acid-binding Zn-ribbon protein [Salinibacter ruber]|uniref:AAA family ATPase n=1 Tax=Salinibacter ruber TaxID=146919 RepID=UPI002169C9FB|nr:AAA family ATPase [Salinibacter ruber]MCS3632445.1 putative nucleic acid-binding Zn-ribbon protein [Salinibacter ruber]